MNVHFCDPHSPWEQGGNERTFGLLRPCFPQRTDLSFHGPERLLEVASKLNGPPRKEAGGIAPTRPRSVSGLSQNRRSLQQPPEFAHPSWRFATQLLLEAPREGKGGDVRFVGLDALIAGSLV
jgi:hypothetical protein